MLQSSREDLGPDCQKPKVQDQLLAKGNPVAGQ